MRRLRYVLILAVVLALVAGICVAWRAVFPPSLVADFNEELRLPQYMPEVVEWRRCCRETSNYAEVRAGHLPPFLILHWETVRTYNLSEYIRTGKIVYNAPHVGMTISVIGAELEVDLGGQRTPVNVDGVEGWFTRLGPDEFTSLEQAELGGGTSGFGFGIYGSISLEREPGGSERLLGEAIALQWHKDGIHYFLIAQDIEPVNKDELVKMANSMAPSDLLIPSSVRQ